MTAREVIRRRPGRAKFIGRRGYISMSPNGLTVSAGWAELFARPWSSPYATVILRVLGLQVSIATSHAYISDRELRHVRYLWGRSRNLWGRPR